MYSGKRKQIHNPMIEHSDIDQPCDHVLWNPGLIFPGQDEDMMCCVGDCTEVKKCETVKLKNCGHGSNLDLNQAVGSISGAKGRTMTELARYYLGHVEGVFSQTS